VGFVNRKLKYFKIMADSNGKSRDPNYIMKPLRAKWEKLIEDFKEDAPPSM